jgi:pimeloyl-ACP methyl ester carboxylesterase
MSAPASVKPTAGTARWLHRSLWLIGGLALLGYLAICAYMFAVQRSLLFIPDIRDVSGDASRVPGAEAITLTTSDGERLNAWWKPPRNDVDPVYLYLHGNGANLTRRAGRFQRLTEDGAGLLAVSWRGYGGSSGSPSEAGLRLDTFEGATAELEESQGRALVPGDSDTSRMIQKMRQLQRAGIQGRIFGHHAQRGPQDQVQRICGLFRRQTATARCGPQRIGSLGPQQRGCQQQPPVQQLGRVGRAFFVKNPLQRRTRINDAAPADLGAHGRSSRPSRTSSALSVPRASRARSRAAAAAKSSATTCTPSASRSSSLCSASTDRPFAAARSRNACATASSTSRTISCAMITTIIL